MAASTEITLLSRCTYDVFLSFRGTDTRKHFTDHLYAALMQAGIHTFRDDDELPRGENIEAELKKAIRESKISVIVFSKDYASSTWCLDELVMIMKKMSGGGHAVLPIFYDVSASQVRWQTGSFASAFTKHEQQFRTEYDKINQWKYALKGAADLAGMGLKDRYESHFIQDVVREIRNKLHPGKLDLTPHLVGTNLLVAQINLRLQDEAHVASMAIIYGIGGVGKTTIAKIVYNENLERFDSSSFVANVRDLSKEPIGLIRLQNQLLADILKGNTHEVYNTQNGIGKIQNAICCKKVLIIFDDVDESDQLDALLGRRKLQLYPGSKIILTTRNEDLLRRTNQVFEKFQVEGLNDKDSLQLFSLHAFGQHHPIDSYLKLSKEAVNRCGGLPLALEVLGSSLFKRDRDVWIDALQKLRSIPDSKIHGILKISYDRLKDDHDQNLFLDIACFFVGSEKNYVSEILKGCGFNPLVGIQNLVDRCLLKVDRDNELCMHQLLIEMGREIVRQESPKDAGKRSRLWNRRDACTVLEDKTGTEEIRGLVLDLHRPGESSYGSKSADSIFEEHESASSHSFPLNLQTESFVKMRKIQFLKLYGVNVKGNYEDLPKNLVLLSWHGFPLRSIPSNFHLKKLVSLDLSYSDITNFWDGTMVLPGLKFLNLSHCRKLTRMPNFGGLPCLERLIFTGCIRISEVDESITCLKKLLILNLKDCTSLQRFPKHFSILDSLEEINLSGCSNLYEPLKISIGSGTAINWFLSTTTSPVARILSLLSTLWHPTIQSSLTLCKRSCSTNFSLPLLPSSLVRLSLENCNLYDDAFPNFSNLRSLEYLNLSGNPFHDLPEGISNRNYLGHLIIDGCTGIQSLPKLPIIYYLQANNCSSLERFEGRRLEEVKFAWFEQCDKLVRIQDWFKIYSINDIDKAILKSLGFSDLESLADIKVDMFNKLTHTRKTTSLQVLHEQGILNIFLPGDDVPDCFTLQATGNCIGFDILPVAGHKIYGLNVCISYSGRIKSEFSDLALSFDIKNVTKEVKWQYHPTCCGNSRYEEETIQWLSHWKAGDLLEVGDRVEIVVSGYPGFVIKNCAVSLVYEADTKSHEEIIGDLALDQIPLDSSAGKRRKDNIVTLGLRRLLNYKRVN